MRILMLSQFYPPIIGGVEQHVRTLSTELASRGHDVAVVTLRHHGQVPFELDHGVRVYRIRSLVQRMSWLFSNHERRHSPPVPDPEAMLEMHRVIASERPQIVHAHNWLVRTFLPLKNWSKARLIVTLHDYNLACAKDTLMYQDAVCDGPRLAKCLGCSVQHYGFAKGVPTVLGNWVMGGVEHTTVDLFLTVSQEVAVGNELVLRHLPFQIIPNFIGDELQVPDDDTEAFLAQLPSEGFLLFVGAFSHEKGVDILLHAYAELAHAPPLVLIGYPTPEWSLLASASPPNVFVFHNWPHDAVMGAWGRCAIALIPSRWAEPFGIVALEAMLMGKPTIASRVGALPDIVLDGETGFLVSPGDAHALREAMAYLLNNPERREQMGQMAKQRVVEFQAKTVVPRIERVYEQLVNVNGPNAHSPDKQEVDIKSE
jgi:glycosyltransferase involved in cell wall biosynthesis